MTYSAALDHRTFNKSWELLVYVLFHCEYETNNKQDGYRALVWIELLIYIVTFCHQSLLYSTLRKNPYIWSFHILYCLFCPISVPIGIVPGPDSIIVKPNSQAFLHCEVYGNPKPMVTWSKSREQIHPNYKYEIFSNGTLLVRSATEQDVDRYTCVADNGVTGAVERTVKLSLRGMDRYLMIAQETSGCLLCILKNKTKY